MYEDFEKQINEVMENTRKKLQSAKYTETEKKKVFMYERMVDVFKQYVKKQADSNADFAESLSFYWKSAPRMLKQVAENAKKISVDGMAFCPDDEVFDWICNYYAANDKDKVDKELKEAEERKRQADEAKKKELAIDNEAKEKAKAIVEALPEWQSLSESDKKKKLKDKTAEILKKIREDQRKKEIEETKKRLGIKTNSTDNESEKAKDDEQETNVLTDDEVLPWDDELPWESEEPTDSSPSAEENMVPSSLSTDGHKESVIFKTSLKDVDGQISLFDLFTISEVVRC